MSFLIVKTNEKNTIFVTAVPEAWVDNGNLRWPPNHVNLKDRLRSNKHSVPAFTWATLPCIVLKRGIDNFKDALCEEVVYSKLSTDSEPDDSEPNSTQPRNKFVEDFPNYDDFFKPSGELDPMNNSGSSPPRVIAPEQVAALPDMPENTVIDISVFGQIPIMNDRLSNFERDTKTEISKLHMKIDKLLRLAEDSSGQFGKSVHEDADEEDESDIQFPLTSVEMIEKFDMKLDEKSYLKKMVKKFAKVIGTNGHQDGKKVAYILVDKIFSRAVLKSFTWTGHSKTKDKLPFSTLKNVWTFFTTLIYDASQMSEPDLELFFKNCILKHAEARASNASRSSIPRTSTTRTSKCVLSE